MTPSIFLNKPNFLINYMFSIQTNDGRNTLRDVIKDSDPTFVRWAMAYIQQWKKPNLSAVTHIHRIHGKNDRIFPNVKPGSGTAFVQGGHFAVYETAEEVNNCLKSWL